MKKYGSGGMKSNSGKGGSTAGSMRSGGWKVPKKGSKPSPHITGAAGCTGSIGRNTTRTKILP